jgi:hypothetical protein
VRVGIRLRRVLRVVAVAVPLVVGVWVGLLAVRIVLVARDDPMAECAARLTEDKAGLARARWVWLPPGWVCEEVSGERLDRVP